MTELNTFVAELATLFDKQFDNPFGVYLANSIMGYRATIYKQEFDKNGRYPIGGEDSLVLPLIRVKPIECCCGEDMDCQVARTKDKVPSAVRGNFKSEPFLYVGASDMSDAYIYAQPHEVENILKGTKFLRDAIIYSYYNGYIYTFNYEGSRLAVRDVFSNLMELQDLQNCDGKPCIDSIKIPDDMKRIIKQMVIEEFRMVGKITPEQEVKINESGL